MGTWTRNTSTNAFTLSGSGATVALRSTTQTGRFANVLDLNTTAHEVKAVLFATKDRLNRIEVGVVGANVVMRKVALGGAAVVLTNSASDLPASASCSVAHGLTAGVPYQVDARVVDGTIELWINETKVLSHQLLDTETYYGNVRIGAQKYVGFVSSVSGAVVQRAQICSLVPGEITPQTEVDVIVVDGNVFMSRDGETIEQIASKAFNPTGPVSLAAKRAVVYGVDGTNARKIDPSAKTVTNWGRATLTTNGCGEWTNNSRRCEKAQTTWPQSSDWNERRQGRRATDGRQGIQWLLLYLTDQHHSERRTQRSSRPSPSRPRGLRRLRRQGRTPRTPRTSPVRPQRSRRRSTTRSKRWAALLARPSASSTTEP